MSNDIINMKDNNTNELCGRLLDFAVDVILCLRTVKHSIETVDIKRQLTKSCTSAGANYEESQGTFTKKDARMKVAISLKEMRESNYFLQVISRLELGNIDQFKLLVQESMELKAILGSILHKLNVILLFGLKSLAFDLNLLNSYPC